MIEQAELTLERLLEDWSSLSKTEKLRAFQGFRRDQADDFFLKLPSREQLELLLTLPEGERRIWLRLIPPDDAPDVIQLAPNHERRRLLDQLDDVAQREVNALLAYQEDAAGGLMSPRFARLRPDVTVDEAIVYLRRQAGHVETIYYAYALDDAQRLLGVVSFRDLFAADRAKTVREVMRTHFVAASEHTDQEALARLFSTHHLLAIPIVDAQGRMQGIVTVDDIVHVVQEEASEDIQKLGGMEALDAPYLHIGFWRMVRKRAGWLAILFLGEMLTATAMGHFEGEIARAVVLALFVPLIISSGGNSGSQATTLVIRAMAVGEVRLRDWWRVVRPGSLHWFGAWWSACHNWYDTNSAVANHLENIWPALRCPGVHRGAQSHRRRHVRDDSRIDATVRAARSSFGSGQRFGAIRGNTR